MLADSEAAQPWPQTHQPQQGRWRPQAHQRQQPQALQQQLLFSSDSQSWIRALERGPLGIGPQTVLIGGTCSDRRCGV